MARALACVLGLALLAATPGTFAGIAPIASGDIADGRSQGISIAVVTNGKLAGSQSFGAAGALSRFAIGSVTKMFTAVSVMQLASKRKLSLDDSVAKYYPQYPNADAITIRELLGHTSGIPNLLDDALASGDAAKSTTPDDMIVAAARRKADFPPGTDWNYSNTGYVLLGRIVEKVSGKPLAVYERQHIFDPLGMDHTGPPPNSGVVPAWEGDPGDWSWYYAAGDIFSTAVDLARFDIGLMNGTLLGISAFRTMQQTSSFPTLEPGLHDGLGLFVRSGGTTTIIGHHGGLPGYRSDNEMVPANGFAVVVLGNGSYNTAPIVHAVLQSYVPGAMKDAPILTVDPAPDVTARAGSTIRDMLAGTLDRSQFEPLVAIQLPPNATIAKQLSVYGELKNIAFQSKAYTSSGKFYVYVATFAKKTVILSFRVADDGKFASFVLTN